MDRRQWISKAGASVAVGMVGASAATAVQAASRRAVARGADAASGLAVEAVQMPAWTGADTAREPLAPGDVVSRAQSVHTDVGAGLVLRLPEGSLIRLGEKTQLGVQRLEVDGSTGVTAVRSRLQLLEGFFRFATSSVSKVVGTRDVEITLRTATVGIRGTDLWAMTDTVHDAACLFEGRVDVATATQGTLALDKPTAFWANFFDKAPQPVGVATPDELARFLASTELKPGRGVAIVGGAWRVLALTTDRSRDALELAGRLRAAGYPARLRGIGSGRNEVVIEQLATQADAQAVLERIASVSGVQGRVARA
jgi:hypothetical protein